MKIRLTESNREKIESLLFSAQKRCTQRILTFNRIAEILDSVDQELSIPKTKMKGVSVVFTGAEKLPTAYRFTPESTHFDAIHDGSHWYITDLHRGVCPNRKGNVSVILTEDAKKALVDSFNCFQV